MMFHVVLNLSITSIPPIYDIGYLEDARHLITVEVLMKIVSFEVHIPIDIFVEEVKLFTTPITKQLSP